MYIDSNEMFSYFFFLDLLVRHLIVLWYLVAQLNKQLKNSLSTSLLHECLEQKLKKYVLG